MIVEKNEAPEHLSDIDRYIKNNWSPIYDDKDAIDFVRSHLKSLIDNDYVNSLSAYNTFVPPRLVNAAKIGNVSPFFGAGVSIAAGIPTWNGLLKNLGVSEELVKEPNLEHDPLTLAELLAHEVGYLELQKQLRAYMESVTTPSIAHYMLAQLSQGVYITTNYDTLFEIAWKKVNHGSHEPMVITNDADFNRYGLDPLKLEPIDDNIILLKIHGCASRYDEELILTRSQYRKHYRTNKLLFESVTELMLQKHILFVGFSHKDPEITRLVDDAIHEYEKNGNKVPEYYETFAQRGEYSPLNPEAVFLNL